MKDKSTKSHTTLYFPKEESDFLMRASKLRGEQLFGRSSHGKVSAYITRLIKKDLKEHGILKYDDKLKKLLPVTEKLEELEKDIIKKLEQDIMDSL